MRQSPPNRTTCPIRLAGSGTGGPLSVPSNLFASARRAIRQLVSFKETAAAELDKVRPMGLGSGGGTGGPDGGVWQPRLPAVVFLGRAGDERWLTDRCALPAAPLTTGERGPARTTTGNPHLHPFRRLLCRAVNRTSIGIPTVIGLLRTDSRHAC